MTTEIQPTRPTSGEQGPPDPEVVARAKRRRFTAEYRMSILRKADACTHPGQIGALLRREGLYSSHLAKWRRQRDDAAGGGFDKPRGRKPTPAAEVEAAKLRHENARLKKELAAAHMVIDVQKNVSALLGIALESAEPGITP